MSESAKTIFRPLFIFAFIEALIFWYAIEKLLWASSGITAEQIVTLGIIAQVSQVLIEVPSSVLADKWSRRNTLILSSCFMAIAIMIVLAVQTYTSFLAMSLVWALYFSFQSGTINAYIYDLLKEKHLEAEYRKVVSRYGTLQLSGLLVSSLGASVLVKFGDLLTPYWATLIPTFLAIGILLKMNEPDIDHDDQKSANPFSHVNSAVKGIASKQWLRLIFVSLAFVTAGRFIWYEYYQLYSLEREVAAVLFGVTLALIHIGNITGAEFAHRVKSPNAVLLTAYGVMLLSAIILAFAWTPIIIIPVLAACFFGSQASSIVLDESLQHATSSDIRATTLSLAGLVSRILFGLGAVAIIVFDSSAKAIALVTVVLFLFTILYYPSRSKLLSQHL